MLPIDVVVAPAAFDSFATTYDDNFTHSQLGQLLRPRVWAVLARHFAPGQRVLELACGTGEDALWLARRGVHMVATDGSAEMVRIARSKAVGERGSGGAGEQIEVLQLSLQEFIGGQPSAACPELAERVGGLFDGVFSNFGGLNTIGVWRTLAEVLAKRVRPGGKVILVPMGPICPWEIVWQAGHGQFKTAFRRWGSAAPAKIGPAVIPIWYPSAGRLRADFSPWFRCLSTESLGLWLPPSYLEHLVKRWPGLFARLNRLEQATARLTGGWGDHYIIVFEKNNV